MQANNPSAKADLSDFISQTKTDALVDENFSDWHRGIPFYGFWAIIIRNKQWLTFIQETQAELSHYFLPGYARQAHITLNACGLLDERHFSKAKLEAQCAALDKKVLSHFPISLGSVNSFSTAAYISIADPQGHLDQINTVLQKIATDSAPLKYTAHLTLGLYRDHFNTRELASKLSRITVPTLPPIQVTEIQFCKYQTQSIQGKIQALFSMPLD